MNNFFWHVARWRKRVLEREKLLNHSLFILFASGAWIAYTCIMIGLFAAILSDQVSLCESAPIMTVAASSTLACAWAAMAILMLLTALLELMRKAAHAALRISRSEKRKNLWDKTVAASVSMAALAGLMVSTGIITMMIPWYAAFSIFAALTALVTFAARITAFRYPSQRDSSLTELAISTAILAALFTTLCLGTIFSAFVPIIVTETIMSPWDPGAHELSAALTAECMAFVIIFVSEFAAATADFLLLKEHPLISLTSVCRFCVTFPLMPFVRIFDFWVARRGQDPRLSCEEHRDAPPEE